MKKTYKSIILATLFVLFGNVAMQAQEWEYGDVLTPPYTLNMRSTTEKQRFMVADFNEDGLTWQMGTTAFWIKTHGEDGTNDWLITPGFDLTAGVDYTIEFTARNRRAETPEVLSLLVGQNATTDALTTVLLNELSITNAEGEKHSVTFRPTKSGVYCFGFQCTSRPNSYRLYLDAFSINIAVVESTPSAVTDAKVTSGEMGALSANIEFVTPTKNIDDSELTSLTKAVVRNLTTGNVVFERENPGVGQLLTGNDTNPAQGINRYEIVCSSAAGDGVPVVVEKFIGVDVPKAVTNINWTQNGKDVEITWDAVSEEGVNGGYVDPAGVTYKIEVIQPTNEVIATSHSGLSITDKHLNDFVDQCVLQYTITPTNAQGSGLAASSFRGVFGTPYNVPMSESFANKQVSQNPWFFIDYEGGSGSSWEFVNSTNRPVLAPQDNDGGMAVMHSGGDGSQMICSPIYSLDTDNTLKFWVCHTDANNQLEVMLSEDAAHTWTKLQDVAITAEGWEEVTIPLTDYAGKSVILGFKGTVKSSNFVIAIDNIRITGTTNGISLVDNEAALVTDETFVMTIDGKFVGKNFTANDLQKLSSGVYIVRQGQSVKKVVIR